jgi:RHS repeat-associated protein
LDAAGKQMKEQISYDLNGNILSLNRTMGGVEIDNLAYSYKPNSNQLQAVTDNITAYNGLGYNDGNKTANNFTYDNNGSMTSDLDKSLALTYNRLNLVQTAQINSSKQVYLYNTQGNKMAQKVDGQSKAYLFGSEYMNGELSRMQTAEGYVSKNLNWKDGSTEKKYPYSFTVSDHLGNIRVVVDEQGQVQQKNEYTAFGVVQSTDPSKNKYLFNNKELQTGTNYLDYGARMYQPELGRWNVVDPLAQKYSSYSPYNFTMNNPFRFVDPDGREILVPNVSQREPILKMINSRAVGTFAFDNDGKLYQANAKGDATKYSQYYSDKLVEGISSDKKITITIAEKFSYGGKQYDTDKDWGGGATAGGKGTNQSTWISGNENKNVKDTEGGQLRDKPADILAHELVGHAIPKAVSSDTGNAVTNENKVRQGYIEKDQIGKSKIRASEPGHIE